VRTLELHIKSNGGDTRINIQSGHEIQSAHLMLTNGWFGSQVYKAAIVGAGVGNWSQSDLHFVLNSENNSNNYVVGTDTKMIVKNNGNVGIGTISPSSNLHVVTTGSYPSSAVTVEGNVADPSLIMKNTTAGGRTYSLISGGTGSGVPGGLRFYDQTGSVDRMVLSSAGNFGIGTTSPANALEVNGSADITGNLGIGMNTPSSPLYLQGSNTTNAPLGAITMNRYFLNSGYQAASSIFHWADGSSIDRMSFAVTGGGSSYTNPAAISQAKMTIVSTGNVGIGTTAPAAHLSFGTSSGGQASLHLYDGGATVRSGMGINTNEFQLFAANSAHFSFNTGGDLQGVGTNELMRIQPNGNVGIGTTSPANTFEVNGTADFTGNVGVGLNAPRARLEVSGPMLPFGWNLISTDSTTMAAGVGGGIGFGGNYTTAGGWAEWAGIRSYKENGTSGDYGASLGLSTRAMGGSTAERMRITSTGNVGIGTTSAYSKTQLRAAVASSAKTRLSVSIFVFSSPSARPCTRVSSSVSRVNLSASARMSQARSACRARSRFFSSRELGGAAQETSFSKSVGLKRYSRPTFLGFSFPDSIQRKIVRSDLFKYLAAASTVNHGASVLEISSI